MQMKPFFSYYGGKWRIAKQYQSPIYDVVVEPFAGSAGYAIRHQSKNIILVEKDKVVSSVWKYLINANKNDIYNLPLEIHSDGLRHMDIPDGAKALIGFWLNKGTVAPANTPGAWMRSGINPKSFWGSEIRQRIAEQVPHIKHWKLIEGDYTQAPSSQECTWFIDPPYQRAGVHYKMNEIDYTTLGQWCLSLKGQVIVCEEQGAEWLPFIPFVRAKANPSKNGGKVCNECVYINNTKPGR